MAQEGCNLDKDEAEILKPSSPSQPPPTTPTNINNSSPSSLLSTTSPPPTSLCLPQEFSSQKPDCPKNSVEPPCKLKAKKESQPSIQFGSINRCSSCRKRVGLTGFRCRCGDLFCAQHRYSDTHDCSFDYKALGREEIAKANPLIRAAKIIKI